MGKEVKTKELVEDALMRVAADGAADVAAVCAPDGLRSLRDEGGRNG